MDQKGQQAQQMPPPPAGYNAPPPGYSQPPPAYPAQPSYGGTTAVVVNQPMVTVVQQFREAPVRMKCPSCQADIVTATSYEVGTLTWIACFVTAFVGCWLGCCLIPFCVDGCKDVLHHCPNCKFMVGRYNRM